MAKAYKRRGMRKLQPNRAEFRAALKRVGLNQSKLAKRMGWGDARVVELLKSERGLQFPEALVMAGVLKVSLNDLVRMLGLPEAWADQKLPLRGHVDDTGAVILYPDSDEDKFEQIQSPFPGYTGTVVRVETQSGAGRYQKGELLAYTPGGRDFEGLFGKEAFICLNDGRLLFRILEPGSRPDRFNLVAVSSGQRLIVDAEVDWASKIDWHQP